MHKEVFQIGNSLAIILPRALAKEQGLKKGDLVRVESVGPTIQIQPLERVTPVTLKGAVPRKNYRLRDLKNIRRRLTRQLDKKWKNS